MTTFDINLTIDNPALTRLSVKAYDKSRVSVPNNALPKPLFNALDVVFQSLTGNTLDVNDSTLTVSAKDGQFGRLYSVNLFANNGREDVPDDAPMYVRWGNTRIPLYLQDKGSFRVMDGFEGDISFSTYSFHGRGDDPSAELTISNDTDTYILHVPFRFASDDNQDMVALTRALKKADSKVLTTMISEESAGGSTLPVVGLKELPEGVTYIVPSVREVNTAHGTSYILSIKANPEVGITEDVGVWANASLKRSLSVKPIVSDTQPAMLTVNEHRELKTGKISTNVSINFSALEEDPNAIALNF